MCPTIWSCFIRETLSVISYSPKTAIISLVVFVLKLVSTALLVRNVGPIGSHTSLYGTLFRLFSCFGSWPAQPSFIFAFSSTLGFWEEEINVCAPFLIFCRSCRITSRKCFLFGIFVHDFHACDFVTFKVSFAYNLCRLGVRITPFSPICAVILVSSIRFGI